MKVLLDPGIFLFQESDQVILNNIKYLLKSWNKEMRNYYSSVIYRIFGKVYR
jgi:hypothetical protein